MKGANSHAPVRKRKQLKATLKRNFIKTRSKRNFATKITKDTKKK